MITSLRIKNFKAWKDTKPIKFAPLTVFFGNNSSGKSSIQQFLLMLKQTVDSSDRKTVINPGNVLSSVDLGSFEEMIFGRDSGRRLAFDLEWDLTKPLRIKDPESKFGCEGTSMRFEAVIGMLGEKSKLIAVERFGYHLRQRSRAPETPDVMQAWLERREPHIAEYQLGAPPYELRRAQKEKHWQLGSPTKFYGFPDQITASYKNAAFVHDFSLEMERLFRSISYLGPMRSKAQRLYNWTGGEPESVGFSGEFTISALLAAKDRIISVSPEEDGKPAKGLRFQQLIAKRLQLMGLIERFKVQQISAHRKEYEVKVRTFGAPLWVDLPDVGFGVAQILPVLVQCFYATPGSILCIEQPEVHLHPCAQEHLADLFIDVLRSRENRADRNVQLIIESHSEHFLRRLQLRIAEGTFSNKDVAAYFVKPGRTGAKLEELEVDEYGNIKNWPDNFFGDSLNDLFKMSKAGMERRKSERLLTQPEKNK